MCTEPYDHVCCTGIKYVVQQFVMMATNLDIVFALLVVSCAFAVQARNVDNFFPFGRDNNDDQLTLGNDETEELKFPEGLTFPYYGQAYQTVHLQTNGLLSFKEALPEPQTDNILNGFPLDPEWSQHNRENILIAPFWADVDTTDPNRGGVFYRMGQSKTDLESATTIVRKEFPRYPTFEAGVVLIVTWDEVSFFEHSTESGTDPRNTFQAALITDGEDSFVFFFYDVITWTAGTTIGADAINGSAPYLALQAIVGFNKGDGVHSFTEGIPEDRRELPGQSNIGEHGSYAYQVNREDIKQAGCSNNATDIVMHPSSGSVSGGQPIYFYGLCWDTTHKLMCVVLAIDSTLSVLQNISGTVENTVSAFCVPNNFTTDGNVLIDVYTDGKKIFSGNYTIYLGTTIPPTTSTPGDGGLKGWSVVIIVIGCLVVVAAVVAILGFLYQTRRKRKGDKKIPQEEKDVDQSD